MLRPLPRLPDLEPESDDSGSFGGLADVLEPSHDEDQDVTTSVSMRSMRHGSVPSNRLSAGPMSCRPAAVSIRAPVQVADFAFADTVFANELPEDPDGPPSGPIFFNEGPGENTHCVTPLAFPLPAAAADVDLSTRLRVLSAHVRHAFRGAIEEMRELWGSTAEIVHVEVEGDGGPATTTPFTVFVRRIVALWSCFQWSRADLTRAAMIGLGVFVVAGAIGATTMDFSDAAASSEVRVGRTLDQHTAHRMVVRIKR